MSGDLSKLITFVVIYIIFFFFLSRSTSHFFHYTLTESPRKYVESEVTIHYKSPVRSEAKAMLSEDELARRQAESMKRIYKEERRRKYLQVTLFFLHCIKVNEYPNLFNSLQQEKA